MSSGVALYELGAAPGDLEQLRCFYDDLYSAEFPDPDERESLANMVAYLRGAGQSENGYHIVLARDDGKTVGAAISDYFIASNCGVIEFLVAAPGRRGRGLGTALLRDTETRLASDARRRGRELQLVAAEINDPFRPGGIPDNLDPFTRVRWWGGHGYGRLNFPYVQPALSETQGPVVNLLLAAKSLSLPPADAVPAALVDGFVRDYLVYAMRIEEPECTSEYREMAGWLSARSSVALEPLRAYIGEDPVRSVDIHEIGDPSDPGFDSAMKLYAASFHNADTMVTAADFRELLGVPNQERAFAYHLWSLRRPGAQITDGIASFFTFPAAGFGGYIAFAPALRGMGALRQVIARVERAMIADDAGATGWYIECADNRVAAIFKAHGFFELDLDYVQPPLGVRSESAGTLGPKLCLLYKAFGARYEPPVLTPAGVKAAMRDVFRYVYGVKQPEKNPAYLHLESQVKWKGAFANS
jgi:GNAT superfamily N-acetyltransferase